MFRYCKRNSKGTRKDKLGIVSSLAIATIIAQAGGAFAITNLSNPEYSADGSLYNYVYYGKTSDNANIYAKTNDPILFRVLNTKANDTSNTDALLLLSEYDIYKKNQKWDAKAPYEQSWETDSSIREMLNEETEGGTLKDCFSEQERDVIMETINGETKESDKMKWGSGRFDAYGCGLIGERLFLLSAKEAVNRDYGFADNGNLWKNKGGINDINRIVKRLGDDSKNIAWWLRSACSGFSTTVAIVNSGGNAGYNNSGNTYGVRFALNIPLSAIVYTSDASVEGTTSSLAPISSKAQMQAICTQSSVTEDTILNGASKLTILDNSRKTFCVTEKSVSALPGETLTLHYTGAQTGDNEYISIIIKDKDGNGLYYGTPKEVTTADDTVEFDIPELDFGEYTVEVLNEQKNGAKETNYAGLDTVNLRVGSDEELEEINYESLDIVNSSEEPGGATTRKAVITATDLGAGLWKVVAEERATADALKTFEDGEQTQTIVFDIPNGVTTVYVVDKAGNISAPIELQPDLSAPTAKVSYDKGIISLTITDEKAGIVGIDDGEEQQPTDEGYPKNVEIKDISKNKTSVKVVDALGNEEILQLTIDNGTPLITKAYKRIDEDNNVQKAIIKATDIVTRSADEVSGLWKVVATNDADAAPVHTFEDKANEQHTVFNIEGLVPTEVYVVDHAGNISETAVTLEDDNEPPTGEVTYSEGIITLTVTDDKAGIAKIGETEYSNYPASENYNVTPGTESVEMVDALGNKTTKDIDITPPTPVEAFISGVNVTVTATDTDSGLWKVVETNDKAAPELGKFEGKESTETARFTTTNTNLSKVYVVDHAGNVSDEIDLVVDMDVPTVIRGFIK